MDFFQHTNKHEEEYFPMFLMGKGAHSFIRKQGLSSSALQDMRKYRNTNVEIDLLKNHNDTFFLHQLQFDPSHAHAFTLGKFFNRQHTGFRVRDLKSDDALKKLITPIATFKNSGDVLSEFRNATINPYDKNDEFIAIAEGINLPLYIFTYNIEMTQFIFTDLMKNPDQEECIDKSLISRHHAQFISHQIADEARLNNHKFDVEEEDHDRLIKHHKIVTVEYTNDSNEAKQDWKAMPKGLETHDIYLIQHKVEAARDNISTEAIEDQILLNLKK